MTVEELKYLLKAHQLRPDKIRGQNFLLSEQILEKIIATAQVQATDMILEVGPGLGALSAALLKKNAELVAFEVDRGFGPILGKLQELHPNFRVIYQDILSLSPQQWQDLQSKSGHKKYKIVANIPYYLTAKLIQKFLSFTVLPTSMTIMVQKEVAERIASHKNKQNLLSLSVAFYGTPEYVMTVGKEFFYPQPEVDSAILHIKDIHNWSYAVSEKFVWSLIKRGFAAKRKKLINNLATDGKLKKDQLLRIFEDLAWPEGTRAEHLEPKDWIQLAQLLE